MMMKYFLMSACVGLLMVGCETEVVTSVEVSEEEVTTPVMENTVIMKPASPASNAMKEALKKAKAEGNIPVIKLEGDQ